MESSFSCRSNSAKSVALENKDFLKRNWQRRVTKNKISSRRQRQSRNADNNKIDCCIKYNFTTCQPREFHLYAHLRHQKLLEGNRRMKYPVSLHWWGIKKIIVLFLLMLIILLFFWAVSFSVVGSCCPFPVASTVWRTIRAKPEQGERGTGGTGYIDSNLYT